MKPDQYPTRHSPTDAIFVGFAGHTGAGKTAAAKYLRSRYGFQYTRYSQVLQQWLFGGPADRERLRAAGWKIMAGGQQLELNRRLIAELDHTRSAAIDGLRHPVDFDSLSSAFGESFYLIFLEARQEVRFERLRSRFSGHDAVQAAALAPVEMEIDRLKALATTVIANEGTLDSLYDGLDSWIASRELEEQQ